MDEETIAVEGPITAAVGGLGTATEGKRVTATGMELEPAAPYDENQLVDVDELAELRAHFEAGELSESEIDTIADIAVNLIRSIFNYFGERNVVVDEYEGDDGELILDLSGGDFAVLIGRHGRTLDALQLLVSSLLSNRLKFHFPIVVDIEGYKSRRRSKLESLARSAASRAKRHRGRVTLPPMNSYDRRIVHLALVDDVEVSTHSEGNEPERRVVVTYVNL